MRKKIAFIAGVSGKDGAYTIAFLLKKGYTIQISFTELGIDLEFIGKDAHEKVTIKKCNNPEYQLELGKEILAEDSQCFRATKVELLHGDPTKATPKMGSAAKYDLDALLIEIEESDLEIIKKDRFLHLRGSESLFEFLKEYE